MRWRLPVTAMIGAALLGSQAPAQQAPAPAPRPVETPAPRPPSGPPPDSPRPPARPDRANPASPEAEEPASPAAATVAAGDATAPDDGQTEAPPAPAGPPAWQHLAEDEFSYQSCLLGLHLLQVSYEETAPLTSPEDRDCGIARPLRVSAIQPGIEIPGGAEMRCDTARQLALWLREEVRPAATRLPGAPRVTALLPGSTYQCRARVGGESDKLSEHALGNAFDLAGLRLSDGTELPVVPRTGSGGFEEAFQKAIRYGACLYFTTVLGPGSNAAHDDHLHFDLAARNGGWRLCE